MELQEVDYQYDQYGRLVYNSEFHLNHGKPYTQSDLEYLCKFWGFDEAKSLAFALGRPEHSLASKVNQDNLIGIKNRIIIGRRGSS
ncbi:DNA-entry nuclease [Niallia sp. FSL W8-0177]|uniref:DNA-entry nuclease n=1 Tax=Niallia sp. FSL W8-0177 TaxID=2954522 RepID=UPI0030F6E0EB